MLLYTISSDKSIQREEQNTMNAQDKVGTTNEVGKVKSPFDEDLKPETKAIIEAIRNAEVANWNKISYVVQEDTTTGTEYLVLWVKE